MLLGQAPKLLLNPVWGIMVATLLAVSGHGELLLKSVGILLAALWLIVNIWFRLLPTNNRWRILAGWAATNALLIAAMGTMYWWLHGKLQDEQDDVFQHLALDVRPSMSPNPLLAMFTMRNDGNADLDEYEMECYINLARYEKASVAEVAAQPMPSSGGLKAGGDAESAPCLAAVGISSPLVCVDVTVHVHYVVASQPDIKKEKPFRFVGHREGSAMAWDRIPVEVQGPYFCR